MFSADERDASGMPKRYERIPWHNGNQLSVVIADGGVSVAEAEAIRDAMHGTPIATVWPPSRGKSGGFFVKVDKP